MAELVLHGYHRSSAAYRVRIALNLKGLAYEQKTLNLLNDEHLSPSYQTLNPQSLVPTLEHHIDGQTLTVNQSLAIIEYLNEQFSGPALLPETPFQRAKTRAFAQNICCDTHPLNNLRVLKYLKQELGINNNERDQWYAHWIQRSFTALDPLIKDDGEFCFGHMPTLADACLIPQVFNALRFNCDISSFKNIQRVYQHCNRLPAFIQAAPERQPDAT